ncbi:MAG: DoxX family protein [Candidatus Neomarinimicrobiota bacterium]
MQYAVLSGRILYSLIFITSGLMGHLMGLESASMWVGSKGVPLPSVAVIVSGIVIIVGGISVLVGYKAKIGAALLLIFLVIVAFVMHDFWDVEDQMMSQMQMAMFMKNISMAGAAIIIMYFGSGPLSLEKKDTKEKG